MKKLGTHLLGALVTGILIVAPAYLAVVILLQALGSLSALVQPVADLLPDWLPGPNHLALTITLLICFLIGMAVRTRAGEAARGWFERTVLERLPVYKLVRNLTQRMAGRGVDESWQPALVEIEEALVPAFIVEEIDPETCTVFVPSVPTPFAGAVYVIDRRRVHPVDVRFADAIRVVSHWGDGSKVLVQAMRKNAR